MMNFKHKIVQKMFWYLCLSACLVWGVLIYNLTSDLAFAQTEPTDVISESDAISAAVTANVIPTEVGPNDFQISSMGTADYFDMQQPEAVYNSQDNEYLVMWLGIEKRPELDKVGPFLYMRRIDGTTGQPLTKASHLRLSGMNVSTFALSYNSQDNNYLLVWDGGKPTLKKEIFGTMLVRNEDQDISRSDIFRISQNGPDGNRSFSAEKPALTYNPIHNEFYVVWQGNDDAPGLHAEKVEIYGARVLADKTIRSRMRISEMGPNNDRRFGASFPDVTFGRGYYFVTWEGKHNGGGSALNEYEIYSRLIAHPNLGLHSEQRQITAMGGSGDADVYARFPSAAYNSASQHFFVTWESNELQTGNGNAESEIFARKLAIAFDGPRPVLTIDGNHQRLSYMGASEANVFGGQRPDIAYNAVSDNLFVTWVGSLDSPQNSFAAWQTFGVLVDSTTGMPVSPVATAYTDPAAERLGSHRSKVVYQPDANEYFLLIQQSVDNPNHENGNKTILAQRIAGETGAE